MIGTVSDENSALDLATIPLGLSDHEVFLAMLIDRDDRTVVLFSHPADGDYLQTHTVKFGHKLPLPEPFNFELDTSKLS